MHIEQLLVTDGWAAEFFECDDPDKLNSLLIDLVYNAIAETTGVKDHIQLRNRIAKSNKMLLDLRKKKNFLNRQIKR